MKIKNLCLGVYNQQKGDRPLLQTHTQGSPLSFVFCRVLFLGKFFLCKVLFLQSFIFCQVLFIAVFCAKFCFFAKFLVQTFVFLQSFFFFLQSFVFSFQKPLSHNSYERDILILVFVIRYNWSPRHPSFFLCFVISFYNWAHIELQDFPFDFLSPLSDNWAPQAHEDTDVALITTGDFMSRSPWIELHNHILFLILYILGFFIITGDFKSTSRYQNEAFLNQNESYLSPIIITVPVTFHPFVHQNCSYFEYDYD